MGGLPHRVLAVLFGQLVAFSDAALLRGSAHNQTSLSVNASSKPASTGAAHALIQMASWKTNTDEALPAQALAEAELEKLHIEDELGLKLDDDKWAVDSVRDEEGIPDDSEEEMAEQESFEGTSDDEDKHDVETPGDQGSDAFNKFVSQDGGAEAFSELTEDEKLGLAQDFAPSFIQEEAHDQDTDPEELAEAEVQNIELAEDLGIDNDETSKTALAQSGSDASEDDDEEETEEDIANDETTKTTSVGDSTDDAIEDNTDDDDSSSAAAA